MKVDFYLVVEPPEAAAYRALGLGTVLELPFHDLGQGSIPARNWIWEHAATTGAERHWIVDDNISEFNRFNYNRRITVLTSAPFRVIEDFTDRYENIAFSGMAHQGHIRDRSVMPPLTLNTRIYSVTLINTALQYRWRGRYNEDTDICLRALKDGWVTVQFNCFPARKAATMTMRGGNTDTVYATGDHRRAFAESLVEQHPDVAKVVWKFNRWHHEVNYEPFKVNKLRYRPGVTPTRLTDEYGMRLVRVAENDPGVLQVPTEIPGQTSLLDVPL
jgi:hypothetical protein